MVLRMALFQKYEAGLVYENHVQMESDHYVGGSHHAVAGHQEHQTCERMALKRIFLKVKARSFP